MLLKTEAEADKNLNVSWFSVVKGSSLFLGSCAPECAAFVLSRASEKPEAGLGPLLCVNSCAVSWGHLEMPDCSVPACPWCTGTLSLVNLLFLGFHFFVFKFLMEVLRSMNWFPHRWDIAALSPILFFVILMCCYGEQCYLGLLISVCYKI